MEDDFDDINNESGEHSTSTKKDKNKNNNARTSVEKIIELSRHEDLVDAKFGYSRITDGPERLGWLSSMRPTLIDDPETKAPRSALDMFFIQMDGTTFKASLPYYPYFYIGVKEDSFEEVESYLRRKYDRQICKVDLIPKEDLELKNHLSGIKKTYMKLSFMTVQSLLQVRDELIPLIKKNKEKLSLATVYLNHNDEASRKGTILDAIVDIREFDITYYIRVSIDKDIRCGNWYNVKPKDGAVMFEPRPDIVQRPECKVLAFDIETTKLPMKFPDATHDQVMMISYMINGEGYLIVNREVVLQDIDNFEYTPKPEYEGLFTVFNVPNELALLEKFFAHCKEVKPNVYVTFNGDGFDWPFVEARAKHHHLRLFDETGVANDKGEYKCKYGSHLDAFCWVVRDSYLPQGSQGLKAVTKAKLGYNPLEIDPEDMCRFAAEQPQTLASYSVSDAVATYYLYMKYVHPFIFSLCTIIPMNPDDVIRKGSGTLCEALLMTEAFKVNVIYPNKYAVDPLKMYKGHLLESETYVGGHVEALESGVFRSDLPYKFALDPAAFDFLISEVDNILKFAVEVEGGLKIDSITNYKEIREDIVSKLAALRDTPKRKENPVIYHLDVAAMYPNIILTNRLQPSAVINEEVCASCIYNKPENNCKRDMEWTWRGDTIPANRSEYELIRTQIESERFPDPKKQKETIGYYELSTADQISKLKDRLKDYSKKVYKSTHKTVEETRTATICQRENPFYVDTVKAFRDRRYIYKEKLKEAQKSADKVRKEGSPAAVQDAQKLIVLFDSLQLAHKCILNSFYGYVMRRGSRWFSMEMGGVVTHTGALIIKQARELIERVGRPLELDTDGIWCMLPSTFPQNFKLTSSDPKRPVYAISFPCVMLNTGVAKNFTNHQYQTQVDKHKYETQSECSILFEVDGPYKAMVLPASKEEGKKIKKRYAVFNHNGQLAELKGFEIKRRGELKLIKTFQSQIFERFLDGESLEECYAAAASVANNWMDILDSQGSTVDDEELLDLLSQTNNMSKKLEDYGKQKSAAITAAKRLGQFLLDEKLKEKGLVCSYVVSKNPEGASVTERVIPTAIFNAEDSVKRVFLRKWCKTPSTDIRDILDWNYYKERLISVIQKIITIPAFMQQISNPVPRAPHPKWLTNKNSNTKISEMFQVTTKQQAIEDMENVANKMFGVSSSTGKGVPVVTVFKRNRRELEDKSPKAKSKRKLKETDDTTTNVDDVPSDDMQVEPPVEENPSDDSTEKKKKKKKKKKQEEEEESEDEEEAQWKWLKEQKKKWKSQLEARKKRRQMFGNTRRVDTQGGRFFQQNTLSLVNNTWEIIQVAEADLPGHYVIWALIDNKDLYPVRLNVPRTFYINTASTDLNGKKVSAELPRNKPKLNLYEFNIEETQYRKSSKYISSLFTAAEVEGVYESKTPLNFKAILQLGASCVVTKKAKQEGPKDEYQLADLELVMKKNYLQESILRRIYMYYSYTEVQRETIGIIALFFMGSNKAHIILVDKGNSQIPIVKNQLKDKFSNYELLITKIQDEKSALQAVDKLLTEYKEQRKGPTAILTQSTLSQYELGQSIPAIKQFPVITVPANEGDNNHRGLMWEKRAAMIVAERYLAIDPWYQSVVERARYAQVPIGNLEADHPIYFSDVLFGRMLKKNSHLLWISETILPDLGGSEEDDVSFAEELVTPEVCTSGCYRNICIEIDIVGLAVNTVLQSNFITELEGGSSLLSFDVNPTLDDDINKVARSIRSFDETFQCIKVFRILKNLITEWSSHVGASMQTEDDNTETPAAILLGHFYRWLSDPSSKLYDPALHRMIHNFIKKVFWQLLAEFRNLGSTIVYANFNKIIINTNKKTLDNAMTYWSFISQNITQKGLFLWIDMQPKRFWETLMFMDSANYGGCLATATPMEKIISNWNIANFLPVAIHKHFDLIVTDFVIQIRRKSKQDEGLSGSSSQVNKENADPNNAMMEEDETEEADKSISSQLSQKLFHLVEEIQRTLSGDSSTRDASSEFPKLAGSYLPLNNPALEFIKTVSQVLALDKSIENDVYRLRKALLKFINIREFSKEAEFVNPCLSYVLHDVMCTFCSSTRDMDLLRDPDLMHDEWLCNHCRKAYSKAAIEATLVEILQRKSLWYQMQDLVCEKCKLVKHENMSEICTGCSGKFSPKQTEADFKKSVLPFKKVAEYHELAWLEETADFMLKH